MKYSLRYLRELTEKLFKSKCPCPEIQIDSLGSILSDKKEENYKKQETENVTK